MAIHRSKPEEAAPVADAAAQQPPSPAVDASAPAPEGDASAADPGAGAEAAAPETAPEGAGTGWTSTEDDPVVLDSVKEVATADPESTLPAGKVILREDPPAPRPREDTPMRLAIAWVKDNATVDGDGKPSPEDVADKAVRAVKAFLDEAVPDADREEAKNLETQLAALGEKLETDLESAAVSTAQKIRLHGYRFDLPIISRVAVEAARHFLGLDPTPAAAAAAADSEHDASQPAT